MKRFIQIVAIVLFTLLFTTVYTYAASDHSPLNTYKHPLLNKLNQMEVFIEEIEEIVKQEEEEKVRRMKERYEIEIRELVEKEKAAVIKEIRTHHMTLQKKLQLIDSDLGVNMLKEFERKKAIEIEMQLNDEIAAYLSDLLLENKK